MADKPTTVAGIIERVKGARRHFDRAVAPLTDAQLQAAKLPGGWSVKDVLAHMAFWDKRLMHAIKPEGGGSRFTPALIEDIPYDENWVQAVNERVYAKNRLRDLADVKADFEQTHERLVSVVAALSEHDVFDPDGLSREVGLPNFFPAEIYGIFDHYDEHAREIEAAFKP
jgi:uncharacterized protein (TIGR03083 family)